MKIAYYRDTNNNNNFTNVHVKHVHNFTRENYTNDVEPQNILRKTYYFLDTNTGGNPILYNIGKLIQRVVNYNGQQEWVFTNKKVIIIIPDLLIDTHLLVERTNSPKQPATVKRHAAQPTQQANAQYGGTSARSKQSTQLKRKTRKTA